MRKPAMKKIALTGGMGTGKSTVKWMFQELGAAIIDADEIAHKLLEPKTAAWKMLFERYGDHIMQKGGEIDRAALADDFLLGKKESDFLQRGLGDHHEAARQDSRGPLPNDKRS